MPTTKRKTKQTQKQHQRLTNVVKIYLANRKKKRGSRRRSTTQIPKQDETNTLLRTLVAQNTPKKHTNLDLQLTRDRYNELERKLGERIDQQNDLLNNVALSTHSNLVQLANRLNEPKFRDTNEPHTPVHSSPATPATMTLKGIEAMKAELKKHKDILNQHATSKNYYTDEKIDGLQGNRLFNLYSQHRPAIQVREGGEYLVPPSVEKIKQLGGKKVGKKKKDDDELPELEPWVFGGDDEEGGGFTGVD